MKIRKRAKRKPHKIEARERIFVTIDSRAQAMIEVTFSVIVIVALILGMIRVFAWVSRDLSTRRGAHEQVLMSPVAPGSATVDTYRQLRPEFFEGSPVDAALINSEIFGSNRMR